ncbi:unnamed protein product [Brachionus calyciflorus]|uniref:Protein kinase domain-containing protein n=1 Tax=Brachionus calyciflorus TaxID=104777 RepID=A0A813VPR6_9BILA|nr:unnamed protein product [Brachionus calyciflorus]
MENDFVKRPRHQNDKQITKTNEISFKERKINRPETKSRMVIKKNALKIANANLNSKLNFSDSMLAFSDSNVFNDKLTLSSNTFRGNKTDFKETKLEPEDPFNIPLSGSISKWSKQVTPIRPTETNPPPNNTALIELKDKKPKIEAKLVLQPPNEINRLMDIIDRENTNFSIKIAYDNLFASRLDVLTPHTYLGLDIDPHSALTRENTIKNMQLFDSESDNFRKFRQKTNASPEIYQTIQQPAKQSLYTELVLLEDFYKKNPKRPSPSKTLHKKKLISKQSVKYKDKNSSVYSDYRLDVLDSSVITEKDDDTSNLAESAEFYTFNNNFTQSSNSMFDLQDKLKTNYQKNNDLGILEGLANSIKLKENLKDTPMYICKKTSKNTKKTTNVKAIKKPSIKEFKYCILTDLKIGEGEFSETFQGYRYDMGAPVKIAAKRLKISKVKTEQNVQNLLSEIAVLTQLGKHNYVIDFLGVHTHLDTMYLVFEYAEKGDLKKLLDLCRKSNKRDVLLNGLYKLRIAYEIASGMEYISSLEIVHKDLAARNILLDSDYSCKIADFGCCKAEFLTKMPIRWMAPESLNKLLFTTASDVWSYGVLLWELYTYGITPYPGMTDDEVVGRINQWYRLYKPQDCPNEVYAIMLSCWKDYHKARPRFTNIKNKFRDLYKIMNESQINSTINGANV